MIDSALIRAGFASLSRHLDERERRLFAAMEASSAGYGGIAAVSLATGFAASTIGRPRYPDAKRQLISADGGGSNGSRVRLWKRQLQDLADEPGIDIVLHHLPPATPGRWRARLLRCTIRIYMNFAPLCIDPLRRGFRDR